MTDEATTPARPGLILLATDLSARCDRALDRAAQLAREWGAGIVAVHVLEPGVSPGADAPSWRRPADPAAAAAAELRADLLAAVPRVDAVVERGDPAEVVARVAAARGCGLLVAGMARSEPLGRLVLGTTVERLLRRCAVPVLVAKARERGPYRSVVVATDLSAASRPALRAAAALFPGRPLALFHAYGVPFQGVVAGTGDYRGQVRASAAADLAAFAAATGLPGAAGGRLALLAEEGAPGPLLRDYVLSGRADLVVLGTRARGPLAAALLGSGAAAILDAVPCDVLVVPAGQAG